MGLHLSKGRGSCIEHSHKFTSISSEQNEVQKHRKYSPHALEASPPLAGVSRALWARNAEKVLKMFVDCPRTFWRLCRGRRARETPVRSWHGSLHMLSARKTIIHTLTREEQALAQRDQRAAKLSGIVSCDFAAIRTFRIMRCQRPAKRQKHNQLSLLIVRNRSRECLNEDNFTLPFV